MPEPLLVEQDEQKKKREEEERYLRAARRMTERADSAGVAPAAGHQAPSPVRSMPTDEDNPFLDAARWMKRNEKLELGIASHMAAGRNPEEEARIYELSEQADLPPHVVRRHKDDIERELAKDNSDLQRIVEQSPVLSQMIRDKPEVAAVLLDDAKNLSGLEWLRKIPMVAMKQGWAQVEYGKLNFRLLNNLPTAGMTREEVEARVKFLEEDVLAKQLGADMNFFEVGYSEFFKMVPYMASTAQAGMMAGIAAYTATAAIPGDEIVTVPAAMAAGSMTYTTMQEAGFTYAELKEAERRNGREFDPNFVYAASWIVGALNGAMEMSGFSSVMKMTGMRRFMRGLVRERMTQRLARRKFRHAVGEFAKNWGEAATWETGTEIVQEATPIMARWIGKKIHDGEWEEENLAENIDQLIDVGMKVLPAMIMMGGVSSGPRLYVDAREINRVNSDMMRLQGLTDAALESKVRDRLPQVFRIFNQQINQQGNVPTSVRVPLPEWDRITKKAGFNPADLATEILEDNGHQYSQLAKGGGQGDLVIPMELYLEKVAGTQIHDEVLHNMRLYQGRATFNELSTRQAELSDLLGQSVNDVVNMDIDELSTAQRHIYDDLFPKLEQLRGGRQYAQQAALLNAVMFERLAQKAGVDPIRYYNAAVQIEFMRPEHEGLVTMGGRALQRMKTPEPWRSQRAGIEKLETHEEIVRDVAAGLKRGDPAAISQAAPDYEEHISSEDVLVPKPDETGSVEANLALANELSRRTGAKVRNVLANMRLSGEKAHQEAVEATGAKWDDVQIIKTRDEYRAFVAEFGIPSALPVAGKELPTGKSAAMFVDEDTGKAVAVSPVNVSDLPARDATEITKAMRESAPTEVLRGLDYAYEIFDPNGMADVAGRFVPRAIGLRAAVPGSKTVTGKGPFARPGDAWVEFSVENGKLYPHAVQVSEGLKRKGVASYLYRLAEVLTGLEVETVTAQTEEGAAFRKARKFEGLPLDRVRELAQELGFLREGVAAPEGVDHPHPIIIDAVRTTGESLADAQEIIPGSKYLVWAQDEEHIDIGVEADPRYQAAIESKKEWRAFEPERTEVGKIMGAPEWVQAGGKSQNTRRYKQLLKDLRGLLKEGEAGRFWYENSARQIMRMVRGDIVLAEKFAQVLAIYSQNSDVAANFTSAVRAFSHWRLKRPRAELHAKTELQDEKARAVLYDDKVWMTKDASGRVTDSRKTSSFYLNLMHEIVEQNGNMIDELTMDEELADLIKGSITADLWMTRAFGYDADRIRADRGRGRYSLMEGIMRKLSAEQVVGDGEVEWLPHQVQAAIWTATKARYTVKSVREATIKESVKRGHSSYVDGKWQVPQTRAARIAHNRIWRKHAMAAPAAEVAESVTRAKESFWEAGIQRTQAVTWEAIPSTSLKREINTEAPDVREAFTSEALSLITDDAGNDLLAQRLGVALNHLVEGTGGYDGNINPNVMSGLVPVKTGPAFQLDEVAAYARAIQYIFKQDAVPFFRADHRANFKKDFGVYKRGAKNAVKRFDTQRQAQAYIDKTDGDYEIRGGKYARGVRFMFAEDITPATEEQFFASLQDLLPDAGFSRVSPREIVVINFRDDETGVPFTDDEEFLGAVDLVEDNHGERLGIQTVDDFGSEGRYGPVQDWAADPEGKTIKKALRKAGRSDLLAWLDDRAAAYKTLLKQWSGKQLEERKGELAEAARMGAAADALADAAHAPTANLTRRWYQEDIPEEPPPVNRWLLFDPDKKIGEQPYTVKAALRQLWPSALLEQKLVGGPDQILKVAEAIVAEDNSIVPEGSELAKAIEDLRTAIQERPAEAHPARFEDEAQRLLRQISSSRSIRFGNDAPHSQMGPVTFRRKGFADIPVVEFTMITPDPSAMVQMARQHLMRAVADQGLDVGAIQQRVNIEARYRRKRKFTDVNKTSKSHGRNKMGYETTYNLEIDARAARGIELGMRGERPDQKLATRVKRGLLEPEVALAGMRGDEIFDHLASLFDATESSEVFMWDGLERLDPKRTLTAMTRAAVKGKALSLVRGQNEDADGTHYEGAGEELLTRALDGLGGVVYPGKRELVLIHRSKKTGLTELDPEYQGTGLGGEEFAKRQRMYPEDFVKRLSYTIEGEREEVMVAKLPYLYRLRVPEREIYDLSEDPQKIMSDDEIMAGLQEGDALGRFTRAEKYLKGEGWTGYRVSKGPKPGQVVLFKPVPAEEIVKSLGETVKAGIDAKVATRAKVLDFMRAQEIKKRRYQGARGYVDRLGPARFNVQLLDGANASTVFHEMAHVYLDLIGDLAELPDATLEISAEYADILRFLGVKRRGQLKRKHQERFARAFEEYLREGTSPDEILRGTFAQIRDWMMQIYEAAKPLVKMTQEVHEVFDQMFTSHAAVVAAREQMAVEPHRAITEGMSDAERAELADLRRRANEEEEDEIRKGLLSRADAVRHWYDEQKERIEREVEEEFHNAPRMRAVRFLQKGTMFGLKEAPESLKTADGRDNLKLSRKDLVDEYGHGILKELPGRRGVGGYVYSRTANGVHPDAIALQLGFDSGTSLVEALRGAPNYQEAFEEAVEQRLMARHGKLLQNKSELLQAALKATHGELRIQQLLTEIRYLRRKLRPREAQEARRAPFEYDDLRIAAELEVESWKVGELRPGQFQRTAQKHGTASFKAMEKGDLAKAYDERFLQTWNMLMFRATRDAKLEAERALRYFKRMQRPTARERLGRAGEGFLEMVDGVLETFSLKKESGKATIRRQDLRAWIERQRAENHDVIIDEEILDRGKFHYSELTMNEFRDVRNAIMNIDRIAKQKTEIILEDKRWNFNEAKSQMIATMKANIPVRGKWHPDEAKRTAGQVIKQQLEEWDARFLRIEEIIDRLDGRRADGPWSRYWWNPLAKAQADEGDLTVDIVKKLADAFDALSTKRRVELLSDEIKVEGLPDSITRQAAIVMALNMGNASNMQRLLEGGADLPGVQAGTPEWAFVLDRILKELTAEDWQFVQNIWDTIEEMWPKIEDLERRLTGVPPKKVKPTPFTRELKDGSSVRLRGGYYPLVYSRKSGVGRKQIEAGTETYVLFDHNYARAMTPHGWVHQRAASFKAPIRLDMNIIISHLQKVVHDLTHREALLNAHKLLHDQDVKDAMWDSLGEHWWNAFDYKLRTIAGDRMTADSKAESLLRKSRMNVTVAAMAFKATITLQNIANYANIKEKIKWKYLGPALRAINTNWAGTIEMVHKKSGEMRHRFNNLERDIRQNMEDTIGGQIGGKVVKGRLHGAQKAIHLSRQFGFGVVAFTDKFTAYPAWLGAYEQAKQEQGYDEKGAIAYADRMVRTTLTSGAPKDIANIQAGGELYKSMTMFFTWFSGVYMRFRSLGYDIRTERHKEEGRVAMGLPWYMARLFCFWFVPAMLAEILSGRGPDSSDPEDIAEWGLMKTLFYPPASIPVVRDIASLAESGIERWRGKKAYRRSIKYGPIGQALEEVYKGIEALLQESSDLYYDPRNFDKAKGAKAASRTLGYTLGLPSSQFEITAGYLWEVMFGEEDPEDVLEFFYRVLYREREEEKEEL